MNLKIKEKGITLIALVITIIVMLILSAISLTVFIGEDAIIMKANYAIFTQEYNMVEEAVKIYRINYNLNDGTKNEQKNEYPITGERITNVKHTFLLTIQEIKGHEIEIENVNLYKIDFGLINLNLEREYIIDVDTGTVYLLEGEKIGKYIYHIPQTKIHESESQVKKYTITFDSAGGECNISSKTVDDYSTYGELPIPTRHGYKFEGWYTAQIGGEKITSDSKVKIAQNQTLYAQWRANTYTISLNENGGSDVSDVTVTYDQKYINLPTPTRDGHTFVGWYTELCKGTIINDSVMVTEPIYSKLYARWQKNDVLDDFSPNATEVAVFQSADENGDGLADFINYQLKCNASFEKMNIPLTNLIIGKTYTLKFTTCTNATFNTSSADSSWRYGCYVSNEKNLSTANNATDIIINTGNTGFNNWRCTEEQVGKTNTVTLTFTANANTMYWIWEFGAIEDEILYQYEIQDIQLKRVDNEYINFSDYTRLPSSSTFTYEMRETLKWSTKYTFTGASGCERIAYKITGLVSGKTYTISFTEDYMGNWVEGAKVSYEYGCVVLNTEQYSTFSKSPGSHTFLEDYNNSCIVMRSSEGQFAEKKSGTLTISFVASGTTAYWVWDYAALSDSVKVPISVNVTNLTVSDGNVSDNIDTTN